MPMASLNVAEWSADQVADWLSGLGPTVARYVPALRERGLDGAKLLTLRCDDLEYLGMHVIGHQELLLEAVEHLRNFQYEVSRECVQQLALRVSVVATTLARALRHHPDARLETQTLADVARTVHAVKPLVCWLDRWPLCSSGSAAASLAERKAALLKLSLEAATCAQRDRFAEQPARAVAAAAATTATTADYIIQDVSDPMILQPASLDSVSLRQGGKPLGFDVVPSFCGHHQLADIRFGSPAHASGAVHIGDEIVQVGNQCVIGWSGDAVVRLCGGAGAELVLRLRRRAARAPPALATPQLLARARRRPAPPYELRLHAPAPPAPPSVCAPEPSESDDSEPLSPPASPTHLHPDHTRMYPPKPRTAVQRRHTISGDSPLYKRPSHTIEQFWQELKQQRWGHEGGSASMTPAPDDTALYARDKAVSCSTGLELSPRPRTCLGVLRDHDDACDRNRGKLDKAHSTPAYDFDASIDEPGPLAAQTIPESPTTPTDSPLALHSADKADRILDFKKSSSQIGEAILQRGRRSNAEAPSDGDARTDEGLVPERDEASTERILETINIAMMEHRRRSDQSVALDQTEHTQPRAPRRTTRAPDAQAAPAPAPAPATAPAPASRPAPPPRPPHYPVLRAVPRADEPPRPLDAAHISVPLRHITKHDIRVIPSERREMPAINSTASEPGAAGPGAGPGGSLRRRSPPLGSPGAGDIVMGAHAHSDATPTRGHALSPTSAVRGIFPTSKSRSLKKKSSILAKRRSVPARALAARGAAGGVWQRVRARGASQPRWARRHLLLTHNLLYAYRTPECSKADCMIYLEGFTVSAAGEVKSRAHAFKVYHTGSAFYFAADSRDAQLAWIQLIHRATLLPSLATHTDVSKQFSETDYSETESDTESPHKERERSRDRDKEKDKSKFGSLKKLTHRMQRSESHENVPHSSTSLDRKYLRFFYRNKTKDDAKLKKVQAGVPVPTEHYRSYRRVAPPEPAPGPPGPAGPASPPRVTVDGADEGPKSRRLPKPINYIHASNPNLLDFDKSDFVTKPTLHVPKPKPKTENLVGFVTLEQFMLKKQAEERRQLYTNRVLMGVEHQNRAAAQHDLMQRLDNIVPDVIYGEVCAGESGSSASSAGGGKPVSVRGKDGYEKIVYRDEMPHAPSAHSPHSAHSSQSAHSSHSPHSAPSSHSAHSPHSAHTARARRSPPAPERWRDSLRRNDKVHSARADVSALKPAAQYAPLSHAHQHLHLAIDSRNNAAGGSPTGTGARTRWSGAGSGTGGLGAGGPGAGGPGAGGPGAGGLGARRGAHYPHLQCPPTFQAETYSLARLPPRASEHEPDA